MFMYTVSYFYKIFYITWRTSFYLFWQSLKPLKMMDTIKHSAFFCKSNHYDHSERTTRKEETTSPLRSRWRWASGERPDCRGRPATCPELRTFRCQWLCHCLGWVVFQWRARPLLAWWQFAAWFPSLEALGRLWSLAGQICQLVWGSVSQPWCWIYLWTACMVVPL